MCALKIFGRSPPSLGRRQISDSTVLSVQAAVLPTNSAAAPRGRQSPGGAPALGKVDEARKGRRRRATT